MEVQRCKELAVEVGKRFMDDDAEVAYAEPCIFSSFVNADADPMGNYISCDSAKLKAEVESRLGSYNESNAMMNLVLFDQAVRHIARIARILMFPGGNALLVGVGGSGKQSLSKLAAFICQMSTVQTARPT